MPWRRRQEQKEVTDDVKSQNMWLQSRMQNLGRKKVGHIPGSGNGHCGDQKAVFAAEDVKPGRLRYQFLWGGCPRPQIIRVMQRRRTWSRTQGPHRMWRSAHSTWPWWHCQGLGFFFFFLREEGYVFLKSEFRNDVKTIFWNGSGESETKWIYYSQDVDFLAASWEEQRPVDLKTKPEIGKRGDKGGLRKSWDVQICFGDWTKGFQQSQ